MLIGRYRFIMPMMAVGGSLVRKPVVPASAGTFPTTGAMFEGLLVMVIFIVGGLTFFPAWALGPIVQHLLMRAGRLFSGDVDGGAWATIIVGRAKDPAAGSVGCRGEA